MSDPYSNLTCGYTIQLRCDCLIDQNRYIGDDPVGHKCSLPAEWEAPNGMLYCQHCKELLTTDPSRISYPICFGKEYQIKLLEHFKAELIDNLRTVESTYGLPPSDGTIKAGSTSSVEDLMKIFKGLNK